MNFFKTKYRVVTDTHLGYAAEYRNWYCPFWQEVATSNTHRTIEEALKMCKRYKEFKKPVKSTVAHLMD